MEPMSRSTRNPLPSTLILLAIGMAPFAAAQDLDLYRPQRATPQPFRVELPEQTAPEASGSTEVLVERLDALIVLDDTEKVDPEDAFDDATGLIRDFQAQDSLVFSPAFETITARYLGQPITLKRLNQLSRDIILLYRRSGQPVVDVVIPEQKITAGTVQLVVTEARVGAVRITTEGWHWPLDFRRCDRLQRDVRCTRRGTRLTESRLESDLRRLSEFPWRSADLDLRPGSERGTTDVDFQVRDVFPMRAYAGYDDTGVQSLLLDRVLTGFTMGNVFGHDGILSYQGTADGAFDNLEVHSLFYDVAVSDRWDFETYASWAGVEPIVAGGIDQQGESWQAGFTFEYNLVRNRCRHRQIEFGFDFKQTNTNVGFGGVQVFDSAADLVTLRLGYERFDRYRGDEYFLLRSTLFIGPGPQFSSGNTTEAFDTVRAGTSPDFVYGNTFAERLYQLPKNWQLTGRLTSQWASERLLWSETLGFGGYNSVRGYDQRTLNGDCGWIANLELGPDPIEFGCQHRRSRLRLYGFLDMGDAYILDALPGEDEQEFLISSGIGMRYSVGNRWSIRCDYGVGFVDVPDVLSSSTNRFHIGVIGFYGPTP